MSVQARMLGVLRRFEDVYGIPRARPPAVPFDTDLLDGRIKRKEQPRPIEQRPPRMPAIPKARAIRLRRATPRWADKREISRVYLQCYRTTLATGEPHHVDHFYPLAGKTVSGLHVHFNLRVIPATHNLSKNAKVPEHPWD